MTQRTVARQVPLSTGVSNKKNTGVGCHALLQGIFLAQGSNPCLLCRWILYPLRHLENLVRLSKSHHIKGTKTTIMSLIAEEIPKVLGAPHQKWGRDRMHIYYKSRYHRGLSYCYFLYLPNNELSWHMPVLITQFTQMMAKWISC